MKNKLLKIGTHYIGSLLLVFSLLILYRGHNLPGGGFIGGLVAASGIILWSIAYGWNITNKKFKLHPISLMGIGLTIALVSVFIGPVFGYDYMKGVWLPALELPIIGKIKLGTPFLFDIGVYFAVIGFTLKSASSLGTEGKEA